MSPKSGNSKAKRIARASHTKYTKALRQSVKLSYKDDGTIDVRHPLLNNFESLSNSEKASVFGDLNRRLISSPDDFIRIDTPFENSEMQIDTNTGFVVIEELEGRISMFALKSPYQIASLETSPHLDGRVLKGHMMTEMYFHMNPFIYNRDRVANTLESSRKLKLRLAPQFFMKFEHMKRDEISYPIDWKSFGNLFLVSESGHQIPYSLNPEDRFFGVENFSLQMHHYENGKFVSMTEPDPLDFMGISTDGIVKSISEEIMTKVSQSEIFNHLADELFVDAIIIEDALMEIRKHFGIDAMYIMTENDPLGIIRKQVEDKELGLYEIIEGALNRKLMTRLSMIPKNPF